MPTANQSKQATFVLALAEYFREHGFDQTRRCVPASRREFFTSRGTEGDLEGIPGFCVQAINWPSRPYGISGKALRDALDETQRQCDAAGQVIPLLIEKRYWEGGDVGWSHVHLPTRMYIALLQCKDPRGPVLRELQDPIRVALTHIIEPIVTYSRRHAEANGQVAS